MCISYPITEHLLKTDRHTTGYLQCGALDAPLLVFIHGWPELSISWRHQLPVFAALGFRCVAPDMRGYGRSSTYTRHEDFAQPLIVDDMLDLLSSLVRDQAVWIGHDWGSPVVWNMASHHPDKTAGVASLCVPYCPNGFVVENLIQYVDRTVYPEETYPAGQWDYMLYYQESFDKACRQFEANIENVLKAFFRKGNPAGMGKPFRTAEVRRLGGWFGDAPFPDLPRDEDVISEEDLATYTASLTRNGFFGPDSWYMNGKANQDYASLAVNGGNLTMPALFVHAAYDNICDTLTSKLAEPMREACADLMEEVVKSGHWMAQEKPDELNAVLARWLKVKFGEDKWT